MGHYVKQELSITASNNTHELTNWMFHLLCWCVRLAARVHHQSWMGFTKCHTDWSGETVLHQARKHFVRLVVMATVTVTLAVHWNVLPLNVLSKLALSFCKTELGFLLWIQNRHAVLDYCYLYTKLHDSTVDVNVSSVWELWVTRVIAKSPV